MNFINKLIFKLSWKKVQFLLRREIKKTAATFGYSFEERREKYPFIAPAKFSPSPEIKDGVVDGSLVRYFDVENPEVAKERNAALNAMSIGKLCIHGWDDPMYGKCDCPKYGDGIPYPEKALAGEKKLRRELGV